MRIQRGKYKGQKLQVIQGKTKRFTPALVKKSLFDLTLARIDDPARWDFFDLCAGSGQMGYEALSIGFRKVFFCDNDLEAVKAIRFHLPNSDDRVKIFHKDFMRLHPIICSCPRVVLFIDLPYRLWTIANQASKKIQYWLNTLFAHFDCCESVIETALVVVQAPVICELMSPLVVREASARCLANQYLNILYTTRT